MLSSAVVISCFCADPAITYNAICYLPDEDRKSMGTHNTILVLCYQLSHYKSFIKSRVLHYPAVLYRPTLPTRAATLPCQSALILEVQ